MTRFLLKLRGIYPPFFMPENSFHKNEKLKSRKSIEYLFKYGRTYSLPPLKAFYRQSESSESRTKVAVAVPKKAIRHAAKRNLVKRRIREAYRLNKNLLDPGADITNSPQEIVFLYQGADVLSYAKIQAAMRILLYKLSGKTP